ncbi:bacterial regulatory s, tetR family protein [Mycobacterium intracellulare]|nr:bacterial regulatory s, tetR family protein [Mycobacterium intracellulare]
MLSADAIFDEALRVLAEEGAAGLTIRNLAGRLKCSSKTLYQQVGAHEVLVRGVVTRAFAQLELRFSNDAPWEAAVESWCTALRAELLDHPDLCKLMTTADRDVVVDHVGQLMAVLERDGFTHGQAVRAGGILAHVTLSMTLSDVAAPASGTTHVCSPPPFDGLSMGWRSCGRRHPHAAATRPDRRVAVVGVAQ